MFQRRHSPYSRIEDVRRSRSQLISLIVVTIFLGILLGLLTTGLYEYLITTLPAPEFQLWAWILGVFVLATIVFTLIVFRYRGTESERLRIDVALPYQLGQNGSTVEITKLHRFRPMYRPADLGRMLFSRSVSPKGAENQELAECWRTRRSEGKPVQMLLTDYHDALVDALILFALHRHSEDSLGVGARYGWWHIDLERYELTFEQLPQLLKSNRFLQARLEVDKGWKLRFPAQVVFTAWDEEDGTRVFSLRCPRRGGVRISCLPTRWMATRDSLPGKVLGEGANIPRKDWFYVLGSRIEVQAEYRNAVLSRSDNYQQWAADMLARLEEALDFGFFLATRHERMIPAINWKMGDIPNEDDSIWKSVQTIEQRLDRIEQGLGEKS